ncbi:MAG: ATP-binding protein [Sulfobacillus sp.]|nr:ATP-binding protein [Sulfobacillus sp.]
MGVEFTGTVSLIGSIAVAFSEHVRTGGFTQSHDLWELLDDGYQREAAIITSQVAIAEWHSLFTDPPSPTRVLDSIGHQAYQIELRPCRLRRHPIQQNRHPVHGWRFIGRSGAIDTSWW